MQLPEALRLFDKIAAEANFETVRLESRVSLMASLGERGVRREHSVSVEPYVASGGFDGADLERLAGTAREANAVITLEGGTLVFA